MNQSNSERGAALVVSLMLLLALGFVGAALIAMSSSDVKVAGYDRRGVQAQFAAEAGVQELLHRLAARPGGTVTANGLTFDPAIRDTAATRDPNWETRVYAPDGTTPSTTDPSLIYTPTVQDMNDGLDYLTTDLSVRYKWRDVNSDGIRDANEIVLYDASAVPPENLTHGFPVLVIEADGNRGTANRRIRAEATRFPFTPNVLAAISSDNGVDLTGNVKICGHDHDPNTPVGTTLESPTPCSPTYDEATGHLPAVTTTGDPVDTGGSSSLLGFPAVTDTSSTNPFYTLAESFGVSQDIIDDMLARADYTSANDGNPLNGVVYVNGDATGGETFNGTTGSGLIYVDGDLDIAGGFEWTGLIYAEGDIKITGTPWILGAVIARGSTSYAFGGGNPGILYSSEAIRLAMESAFNYVILSWKEM
jgi:Tfp pilus assembly protein PilX